MPHDNKNNEEQYFLKYKRVTTNSTQQQDGELHESYPDKVVDLITTNVTEGYPEQFKRSIHTTKQTAKTCYIHW